MFFFVLYDEAPDLSNKEQISFCPSYIDENSDIYEDFLKFIHCHSGLTGKNLCDEVSSALTFKVVVVKVTMLLEQ